MATADVARPRTVRVPDEMWAWLEAHAAEQERTVAWVIRHAVTEYRARVEPGAPYTPKPASDADSLGW